MEDQLIKMLNAEETTDFELGFEIFCNGTIRSEFNYDSVIKKLIKGNKWLGKTKYGFSMIWRKINDTDYYLLTQSKDIPLFKKQLKSITSDNKNITWS